ncbi:sulfotransferase family 2 domain-containing protein [Pleurocapsales cyanobacterium LEGE 10410]|nr:sulfotransferase family 2 domain-containing protein [Pleurocapsales cyanobacterium LEGE 10410]
MIISLHIPKTAGTSFRKALEEAYSGKIKLDYAYLKINQKYKKSLEKNRSIDSFHEIQREWHNYSKFRSIAKYFYTHSLSDEVEVIHGHFPANKYYAYFKLRKAIYITWVRDPFARMVSNYYFWKKIKDETQALWVKKIFQENWSLEKFCFNRTMRNYQSLFIKDFNIKNFAFIGIVEHYQEDLDFLGKNILHKKLNVHHENKSPIGELKYALENKDLRKKFIEFHNRDYELYNYALSKRREREKILLR